MKKDSKKKTTIERLAEAIGVPVEVLAPEHARRKLNEAALRLAIEHEAKGTPIYYIHDDGSGLVEGRGYRVAVVVAGESGYRWTGTWPYTGAVGETLPYFWGPKLEDAKRIAAKQNERRGVTPEAGAIIVLRSMFRGPRRRR